MRLERRKSDFECRELVVEVHGIECTVLAHIRNGSVAGVDVVGCTQKLFGVPGRVVLNRDAAFERELLLECRRRVDAIPTAAIKDHPNNTCVTVSHEGYEWRLSVDYSYSSAFWDVPEILSIGEIRVMWAFPPGAPAGHGGWTPHEGCIQQVSDWIGKCHQLMALIEEEVLSICLSRTKEEAK
jgi:hypothetical protein